MKVNLKLFERQHKYLEFLKNLSIKDHRKRHSKILDGTKWTAKTLGAKAPMRVSRAFYTRRLWMLYTVKHYHFSKDSMFFKAFLKRTKVVLKDKLAKSSATLDKQIAAEIADYSRFDKPTIQMLSVVHLERILSFLGINFKPGVTVRQKKKALWEYYNRPIKDTISMRPARSTKDVRIEQKKGVIVMVKGRPRNKHSMREAILEDCGLTYDKFVKRYHKKFPYITKGSYSVCRTLLRSDGYDIPYLPRTVTVPPVRRKKREVKKGKGKKKRSR